MKKLFLKYWLILIIFFASLFLLRFFIQPGFPETHDGQLYLARFANFHLMMIDHHFPPRWTPNLSYKFGYPIFNFNYYTPFILGMIPKVLGFDFQTSFKLVIFFSFFIGGFFWYLFFQKKISPSAGLVAGLIYLAAPYQMLDIFVRCSIGEIVALGILPFMLWSIDRLIVQPNRLNFFINTFGLAFLSLTHNIIFFFSIPVLLLFCFFSAQANNKLSFKVLRPLIVSWLLAAGLTLYFWAPALLEKKFTNIDKLAQMSYEYLDHFPTFKQLIYSPWGSGYSYQGSNDNISFQLGPIQWVVSLLSIGYLIFKYLKTKKINFYHLFFSLLLIGSVFFLTPISIPVWKVLPLVSYVQFPWRLITFATLAVAGLAGYLAKYLSKLSLLFSFLAIIYINLMVKPFGWFNWPDAFWYEFPFNTSIMSANSPIWYNEEINLKLNLGHFFDLSGVSTFTEISWKTQEHVYEITAPYETQILERTAYFPGWEVRVDNLPVEINYENPDYPGLITFQVPAGKHTITTRFTENTPARKLGDSVSLLSLIGLIYILSSTRLFKKL